jgi:uncharacterized membrane protein YhaH (DUF805 family)
MNLFWLFLSLEGRIGRTIHAGGVLALWFTGVLLGVTIGLPTSVRSWGYLHFAACLVAFYPLWALHVKRVHDLDRSAWWLIGWFAAPILFDAFSNSPIGQMFADSGASGPIMPFLMIASSVAAVYNCVVRVYFVPGSDEDNDYGAPTPLPDGIIRICEALSIRTTGSTQRSKTSGSPASSSTNQIEPRRTRPQRSMPESSGFGRRTAMRQT